MKRMCKLIVVTGGSFLILRLSTFVIPESICILLSLMFAVILVVLFVIVSIAGIRKWRKTSCLWSTPSLVCLVFLVVGVEIMPPICRDISDWVFLKHLDPYSRIVDNLKNGRVSCANACDGKLETINVTSRPAHVRDIWGARCDDDGAIVLFRMDTDVLLLHEGYFFKDYRETSNCGRQAMSPEVGWPHVPYVRHITGHWYRFSDKPGL